MENIRMIKGEDGAIYLNAEELVRSFLPRVVTLDEEIAALDGPIEGNIIGSDGKKTLVNRPLKDVKEQHELIGMKRMLKGIIDVLNVSEEDINDRQ